MYQDFETELAPLDSRRQDRLCVGIFLETFLAVAPSAPEQCAFPFDFVFIVPFILSSECNILRWAFLGFSISINS